MNIDGTTCLTPVSAVSEVQYCLNTLRDATSLLSDRIATLQDKLFLVLASKSSTEATISSEIRVTPLGGELQLRVNDVLDQVFKLENIMLRLGV